MAPNNQINPGMTIDLNGKIYRIESSIKVSAPKGSPFIKTKLRNLITDELIEKNFKPDQVLKEVPLVEHSLEFLYPEGKDYLFLDVDVLTQVVISPEILSEDVNYLKEGIQLKAMFYGDTVFSVELPQFLELMVVKTEANDESQPNANTSKQAVLETGAKVQVPLFVETGDIIKVDTHENEYIQRV